MVKRRTTRSMTDPTDVTDLAQPPAAKKSRQKKVDTNTAVPKDIDAKKPSADVLNKKKDIQSQNETNGNVVIGKGVPIVKKRGTSTKNTVAMKVEPVIADISCKPSTSTGNRGRSSRAAAARAIISMKNNEDGDSDDGKIATKKSTEGKEQVKKEKDIQIKTAEEKLKTTTGKVASKVKKVKISEIPKKSGVERKLVKKGRTAVDSHCPIASTSHVLEEGDEIWDCMLNQTNIQFNNNKYYIIQLLEDDKGGVYSVWMRWGRVGANGQNCLKPFGTNLYQAKQIFEKKFSDKTRNDWEDRFEFEKVPGKYDLVHLDFSDDKKQGVDQPDGVKKERKEIASKLELSVKSLVELICNIRIMEEAVIEMKYDANKAPLGKLTKEQIRAGYLALLDISNIVNKATGKFESRSLLQACNNFYTRIPHYFGMKVPPLIRTPAEVREKLQLLEALGDIQAAMSFLCNNDQIDDGLHPADRHYSGLQCDIRSLEADDHMYQLIRKYVSLNHGETHCSYTLTVEDVFECIKTTEQERFEAISDIGNRMLLWHGSRLSNWAGILSQGLRIAPPEAPVTGYMFGKGIYFADMCSKSANYCMASCTNPTGLLMLCEVALGKTHDLTQADYNAHNLPAGCQSVKGVGNMAPSQENFVTLADGVVVPLGPSKRAKQHHSLLYNEFIVYDLAQVRLRFLVKVKFNF